MADTELNPYAPPRASTRPDLQPGELPPYRPTAGLSSALCWSLGLTSMFTAMSVVSSILQLSLLGRIEAGAHFTDAELGANDLRVGLLALGFVLGHLTTMILWCIWHARTHDNLRAVGAEQLAFGRHAWGWFFCPLLNLWRPLQATRELWRSADPKSTQMLEPKLFQLWWGTWITGNILFRLGSSLDEDNPEISEMITSTQFDMLAYALLSLAGVFAILLIRETTRRSQKGHARLVKSA